MTATTRWLNGHPTIVLHEFVGKWSTSEFETEILDATPEIENRGEKVVVIFNLLQYTLPSRDVNMLAMMRRLTNSHPANIEMVVVVVRDAFAHSLLKAVRKVLPKTDIMVAVKSLDEAPSMACFRLTAVR